AILVICGTSAWGISGVMRLKKRCRILAALTGAVGAIRSEITTRLTPVPELISRMALETAEPVKSFFKNVESRLGDIGVLTLYDIWDEALRGTPELSLLGDELDALKEVPRALGRYDLEEQRLALGRTERQLEQFLQRAREISGRDSKIKGFIGIAAGIFIVLILI
ncbi:MAG: hypothetical protein GX823_03355, partial [Clostridiales bacterium]|nr:hypothetical protein [Clostridiales bacterium]